MRLSATQTLTCIASTSGRAPSGSQRAPAPPARSPAAYWGRRRHTAAPKPPRVTNERREIFDPEAPPEDDDFLLVDPENPLPSGELGALEREVGLPYEEALFSDEVDPSAEEYWFSEPPGGWRTEKERVRKLPEADEIDEDDFLHRGEERRGRSPLSGVREGATLRGEVVAQIYHHGLQIDIGAEFDGLLPIAEEQWEALYASPQLSAAIDVGATLEVVVHRVRDPRLFRFPVQLAATSAALAAAVVPPQEHKAPMDLRVLTMSPEEVAARSEGQRVWEAETRILQFEDEYETATGGDFLAPEPQPIQLTEEQQAAMDAGALRMMRMLG